MEFRKRSVGCSKQIASFTLLLLLFAAAKLAADAAPDGATCDRLLTDFERRGDALGAAAPDRQKMLFFLHVPRTAGRTFHNCFLKLAHPPSKRCAKSYDVLRLNVSTGSCGLLSSHDDYSATDFLPAEAAIVSQLRDPVGRVLSAYEFAVEVAARVLTRPANYKADPKKTNTRDVWPWSVLVPLMEGHLLKRVEANKASRANQTGDALDVYDNELIMPLEEFVQHPLVDDVLGNGAAMQVLGLTGYSHWPEAAQLRLCCRSFPAARERLLQTAMGRIRHMLHVGLMEELELSIASLAATLGVKLGGPSWKSITANAFSYESQGLSEEVEKQVAEARQRLQAVTASLNDKRRELGQLQQRWHAEKVEAQALLPDDVPETREPSWLKDARTHFSSLQDEADALSKEAQILGNHEAQGPARQIVPDDSFLQALNVRDAFHDCSKRAQTRNVNRRANSLRGLVTAGGQRVEFTSAARKALSPKLQQLIRDRNSMDAALYELGRSMLQGKVEKHHAMGMLETLTLPGQRVSNRRMRKREQLTQPQALDQTAGADAGADAAAARSSDRGLRDEL